MPYLFTQVLTPYRLCPPWSLITHARLPSDWTPSLYLFLLNFYILMPGHTVPPHSGSDSVYRVTPPGWITSSTALGSAALIQAACLCGHHPQSTKVLYLMWLHPHVWMQPYPCRLHYTMPGSLHGLPPPLVSHTPKCGRLLYSAPLKGLWSELFREERKKDRRRKMNYFKCFRGE